MTSGKENEESQARAFIYGKIIKHGPQELRTAYVQLVLGIRRCKDTSGWRIM